MIRNIIFDWSGTLVDDLPAVWEATNFVFRQAGCEEMTLERFRAEFSLPFTAFYHRFAPQFPMTQLEGWFHAGFNQSQISVLGLPHAREFLEFCREHGIRTFLLSTVHRDLFAKQAAATGFGPFLDRAYPGVHDKREMIHSVLEENNLQPDGTLFVGDMQHDIEAARHGGVHSCAVLTGYNTLDQLRASEPELIVEHLGELREILRRNQMRLPTQAGDNDLNRRPVITVGALVFNDAGQALLVRTHKWSDLWGIPGGKIKWGEDSVSALRRELKEETGLEVTDIQFILAQDCIHSPEFYRDAHFVLLNYTARCPGEPQVKLNDEAREFAWVSLEKALAMKINAPTRVLLEAVSQSRRNSES